MAHRRLQDLPPTRHARDNAPDMPVPNINRGAPLPGMSMPTPQGEFGDPYQMRRGGGGNKWVLEGLKKKYPETAEMFDPFTWFGSSAGPGSLPDPSGFAESFGGAGGASGAGGYGGSGLSASSMGWGPWAALIGAGKGMQASDPDSFKGKLAHGALGPSISQGVAGIKDNPLMGMLNLGLGPLQGFTPWGKKARQTDPEWMGMGK